MSTRALYALMVLLGTVAFQWAVGEDAGRAAGPGASFSSFYLVSNGTPPHGLSEAPPAAETWIDIANNTSVEFQLANFSGIYHGSGQFMLNLSISSLNTSGLTLGFVLLLDSDADGNAEGTAIFQSRITTIALEVEHISQPLAGVTGDVDDFAHGTFRLLVNRTDDMDGLLRIYFGNGTNSSLLTVPYGAPLMADAGPDRPARTNQTLTFNASGSRSVDLSKTGYTWDFDASDGIAADDAGLTVVHSYNTTGVFIVTLTLDWEGFLSNDTLVVNVTANLPPIAEAGYPITLKKGTPFTFRGSAQDPDGHVVSYAWDFGDGTNASGQNASHAYDEYGNYTVTLTVRDDGGAAGVDTRVVHINRPPVLLNLTYTRTANTVVFRAQAQDPDANDTVLRYQWSFGDGSAGVGVAPIHTYNHSGTFLVSCTVLDPLEENATGSLNVTISNSAPAISSNGVPSQATAGQMVQFRPTVNDPDGDLLEYSWDFGDGRTSNQQNPWHAYSSAGYYTVVLTVSDGELANTSYGYVHVSAAATTSEDDGSGVCATAVCGVIILVMLLVIIVYVSQRRRAAQQPPYAYQPPYGGTPGPAPYAGPQGYGYQGYPEPQPLRALSAPQRYAKPAAPPGTCPRCGSADVVSFGDGHAKCQNCKKILYTG